MFIFSILIGCNSEKDPDPEFIGAGYFPLEVGRFVEYDVEEIRYSPNQPPQATNYIVREEIVDSTSNQAGGITYVIYRWEREDDNDTWEFIATWSARREINRLVLNEGNIPFIKLSLPVRNGLIWDGNALNSSPEDTYIMTNVDQDYELPNGMNVSSLQVIQEEFDDLIVGERDIRRELYGYNIGLIQREIIQLDLCPIDNCPNEEIIESGTEYKETLRSYGKVD
jgi:hypothetical protein